MDVREYLWFAAKVKGVEGRKRREEVARVMEACDITDVADRLIGKLSKGYRQRACLAQALVNDPEILILDEPTIGLDPRQVVEVRNLIKNLSKEKTVILCTHILPEVSETCKRVIIIHQGRLVALDTPQNLQDKIQKYTQTFFQYHGGNGSLVEKLKAIRGVVTVEARDATFAGAQALLVNSEKDDSILRELSSFIQSQGGSIMEMRRIGLSLEQVFLELVTEEVLE
jgi:ABC-2 type transport system ATP-binding protein